MSKNTSDSKALYPAQLHQQQQNAPQQQQPYAGSTISEDERMARELQARFDREAHSMPMTVTAQPALPPPEMPFNCGHCGATHIVRNAVHNAQFQCAQCKYMNRIAFQNMRPVVIVERGSWVPIPIICTIQ